MTPTQLLLDTVRGMLADPNWNAEGDAGAPEDDVPDTEEERAAQGRAFSRFTGKATPPAMLPALVLPDYVQLHWKRGEIAGELALSHPITSLSRELDESLLSRRVDGLPLGEMRIFDAVTVMAGPLFVLFRVRADVVDPRLFLFDLRDIQPLRIDIPRYMEGAATIRGLLFWQELFCDDRLTPDRAESLAAGLEFLRASGIDGTEELHQRLRERS